MSRNCLSRYATQISQPAAAIDRGVAIQCFLPIPSLRHADTILQPWNRRKIADHDDTLLRRPAMAQQANDTGIDILAVNPFEPARIEVKLVERRFCTIETVEVGDPLLQALMGWVLEEVPIKAVVMRPFAPLADLASHENEFLGRLRIHVSE